MFIKQIEKRNPKLLDASFEFHQKGTILPDTYVIDLDQLMKNASMILEKGKQQGIELYFMLKQLGRNPIIAKELVKLGYAGAVVVDFKEAKVMMKHHIPICNVGHLVQMPKSMVEELVAYGCKYFTVFSIDKIKEINEAAKKLGVTQKIMLKVVGLQDMIYSGQTAGFRLENLKENVEEILKCENVDIAGVTSFPCFLYNEEDEEIKPTNNLNTLLYAKNMLKEMGIEIENVNAPSATCSFTLEQMGKYPVNSGEPGHGLSGTTPMHAHKECEEKPCVTYVSEVSHNFDGKSYCYGGGHYRRSHVKYALVGKSRNEMKTVEILPPTDESIDYYFGMSEPCKVSDTVIMSFRFQIFVTRSNVAIVKGIQDGTPELLGTFNSLGDELCE